MKYYHLLTLAFMFICIFFCWGFMLGQHFGKKPINRCQEFSQNAIDAAFSAIEIRDKTAEQWDHCFAAWGNLKTKWEEHKTECPRMSEYETPADKSTL